MSAGVPCEAGCRGCEQISRQAVIELAHRRACRRLCDCAVEFACKFHRRAGGEASGVPGGVICHTLIPGEAPFPAGDQTNGDHCANNCCVGCLMLMAALPPPPVTVAGAPRAASRPLPLPAVGIVAAGFGTQIPPLASTSTDGVIRAWFRPRSPVARSRRGVPYSCPHVHP